MPMERFQFSSSGQKGSLLILALLLTVIFVILGFSIVSMQGLESRQAAQAVYSAKALYMADAGIQYATTMIATDLNSRIICPNSTDTPCCPYFGPDPNICGACWTNGVMCSYCPGAAPGLNYHPCTTETTKWVAQESIQDIGFVVRIGSYDGQFCHQTGSSWCYQVRSAGRIVSSTTSQAFAERVLKAYVRLNCSSGCASPDPTNCPNCPPADCSNCTTNVVAQYEDFR